MSMLVLILLEFSPTPFAIQLISQELNMPMKVPTDPKISPIICFVRRWSSSRDLMMSLMLLMTLAYGSLDFDGRHHSSDNEELMKNYQDIGGHPVASFFLKDDLVNLESLKLNDSALVTCLMFLFGLPFALATVGAKDPDGLS